MGKEVKTNAMRILDRNKIPYEIINYECDEFIDGLREFDTLKSKKVPQSLEIGLFFCQIFIFII